MTPPLRRARGSELDAATLYGLLRLRSAVFVVEQQSIFDDLDGRDLDPATWHLWVDGERDGDGHGGGGGRAAVAVVRVTTEPGGGSRIGRVATAPSHRGAGIAAHLVGAALELAARPVTLDAQEPLVGWYERFGFRVVGTVFDDAGIPHVPMRLG